MSYHDRPKHQIFQKDSRNEKATASAEPGKRRNKAQVFERDIKKMKKQQLKYNGKISKHLYPEEQYAITKGPKEDKINIRKPNREEKILKRKKEDIKQELRQERTRKMNKKIAKI